MRILAFFFAREDLADSALDALRDHIELGDAPLAKAPLVLDDEEGMIVAVTADSAVADRALALAARFGGRLVANVPQEWTAPRGS